MKPLPCRAETFRTTMSDAARRVIEELLDALPNHQLLEEEDTGNVRYSVYVDYIQNLIISGFYRKVVKLLQNMRKCLVLLEGLHILDELFWTMKIFLKRIVKRLAG